MIKAVIFDLWKTLGEKNMSVSSKLSVQFNLEKNAAFMRKYEESIQLEDWDSMDALAENCLRSFGQEVTEENKQFVADLVQEGIDKCTLIHGMRELLEDLHKSCKIALLSNTASFESGALEKWGVSDLFDAEIYSWEIGSLKPAKENFEAVLDTLQVSAEESVFVDDSKSNRDAAAALGFHVIRAESAAQLRNDLRKLGVRV